VIDGLIAAQIDVFSRPDVGLTAFSPAVDGDLHDDTIAKLAATSRIPLVIGTTRDEMNLFNAFNPAVSGIDDHGLHQAFTTRFGEAAPVALDTYRAARPGASNGALMSAMQTDETFRVPARRTAHATSTYGTEVWSYWFTHASAAFGGVLGSCHGIDIPFVFHNLDKPGVAMFLGGSPGQIETADAFSSSLLAFARTGDPGWASYSPDARTTMLFGSESAPIDDPEPELRQLWEAVQ
jgi:para-nitrobenzyl esterase